ncbi:hypothetical protein CR983_02285 [Candidatus Saccharibacteria bacterium]|nr:MAG: hypothetical protein CR983_02285 [Candidatus Saccharibacteria bacterium]
MKNLFLYKHHPCRQLGHLYEHMFVFAVIRYLQKHGFFVYVDYAIDGISFSDGSIVIEIEAHNHALMQHYAAIRSLEVDTTTTAITNIRRQIESEKQAFITYTSLTDIQDSVRQLATRPWETYGAHTRPPLGARTSQKPISLLAKPYRHTKRVLLDLETSHEFVRDNRRLLPFARLVLRAIAEGVEMTAMQQFGLSGQNADNQGWFGKRQYTRIEWSAYHGYVADLDLLIDTAREYTNAMQHSEAFTRLIHSLRELDYTDKTQWPPDIRKTYDAGKFLPTQHDWQMIATTANCKAILDATAITCRFGKESVRARLRKPQSSR